MRRLSMLTLAVAVLGCATGGDARAQAKYWPWCAYYDAWSYNCGFASLQQCLQTARAEGGICRLNPYGPPAGAAERPGRHKGAARQY
jgi:hypothetical protein